MKIQPWLEIRVKIRAFGQILLTCNQLFLQFSLVLLLLYSFSSSLWLSSKCQLSRIFILMLVGRSRAPSSEYQNAIRMKWNFDFRCRWKKDKKGYAVNNKKKAHLLSTTTHHDGTLDSRNDFEGDWNRPQNQVNVLKSTILLKLWKIPWNPPFHSRSHVVS